ncbi:Mu-like prophage I protein [Pseudomonas flavescens]|uniref:Mu-like prophage I protein n=1 Tax=Phytopseudomonas flavescens TaxID=29435 RepID=A0A1G8NTQ7_9GAMM|nr:phage protease [Pseudomonas flavescens]SDI83639.1 Mu-like prophage I protein [Pseudomonas flavescens]
MKTQLALNTDLSAALTPDGQAPDWVELIPAGPVVRGRDGRQWLFDEPAQNLVVSSFTGRAIDLPIDWEHSTQLKAPKGEEAPAGAWIKQLEIRDGALWGRVDWNARAALQVANREYRFLSPVFDYDPDTTRIALLVSAGITNKPNFLLTALNHENQTPEAPMPLSVALAAVLGLTVDDSEDQAIAAITKLKATAQAANSEHSNIERYMPRADYDAVLLRATNAEQALVSTKKAEREKTVDAEIEAALKAGKITPATTDYHRAACQEEGGLERFRSFVAAAPVVGDPSDLVERKPNKTATALNSEQQAMCVQLGVDPVEFAKTLQSEA